MIRELFTISEEYENMKKYIWDTNRNSMMVFARLAYKRVEVCGFVTTRAFVGECIMNRPIVSVSDVDQESGVVVIMADECERSEVENFWSPKTSVKIITYSECLAVDYRLKYKKIILYGMGYGSNLVRNLLTEMKVDIQGYTLTIVTEQDRISTDKPVYEIEQLPKEEQDVVIITAMPDRKRYQREMLQSLEKAGITDIYLNGTFVSDLDISNSITFLVIDKALKVNKKFYILGNADQYGQLIEDILSTYGICCEGYVEENGLYDMYYEGMEDKFFIVNAIEQLDIEKKCDQLEKMGVSINALAYTGIGYVNLKSPCYENIPDCLVDYAPLYADFNGINVHGNREAQFRIIILGGSTSTTRRHRSKSWVEFLYEILLKEVGEVVIYNFANGGNDVVVELLKLLRDGCHLHPDYVISLSGVNNVWRKKLAVNQFHVESPIKWIKCLNPNVRINSGIEVEEDLFEFWLRIQKIMKEVAKVYGAHYLGVLQPMNRGKENKNLAEVMLFEDEDAKSGAKSFHDNARSDDFYLNLLQIFENEENMYVDTVHYSEQANKIIAERIAYEVLQNLDR